MWKKCCSIFGTKPNLTSFSGNKAPASAGQPIEKGEKSPPSYSLNLNMFRKMKFVINIKQFPTVITISLTMTMITIMFYLSVDPLAEPNLSHHDHHPGLPCCSCILAGWTTAPSSYSSRRPSLNTGGQIDDKFCYEASFLQGLTIGLTGWMYR